MHAFCVIWANSRFGGGRCSSDTKPKTTYDFNTHQPHIFCSSPLCTVCVCVCATAMYKTFLIQKVSTGLGGGGEVRVGAHLSTTKYIYVSLCLSVSPANFYPLIPASLPSATTVPSKWKNNFSFGCLLLLVLPVICKHQRQQLDNNSSSRSNETKKSIRTGIVYWHFI